MQTLILYDKETQSVLDFINNLEGVVVEDNNVTWFNGQLNGIQSGFVLVNGNPQVQIGKSVTPFLNQDVKRNFPSRDNQLSKHESLIHFLFRQLTQEQIDQAVREGVLTQDEANRIRNPNSNPQMRMQI